MPLTMAERLGEQTGAVTKVVCLAGVPGFEPGIAGIKIRCLTTWLHPIRFIGKRRVLVNSPGNQATVCGRQLVKNLLAGLIIGHCHESR